MENTRLIVLVDLAKLATGNMCGIVGLYYRRRGAAAARKAAAKKAAHVRLLDKDEACSIAGASFPTIWAWMRTGTFPRSRVVGGKSKWLSTEIETWVQGLPVRRLKGDVTPAPAERGSGRPPRQRRGGTTL